MEKKENINSYTILRVILTLLVIIGHCAYYSINSKYGGIDFENEMMLNNINDSFFHRIIFIISLLIYSFHMPMFFSLSGALFEYKHDSNQKTLLLNKAKRLLIPFIVVTLVIVIPLKYISGYWNDNLIHNIFIGQFLIQGNTHLWFLPTLFLEFVIFSYVNKYEKINKNISFLLIIIGILGIIIQNKIPIIIIANVLKYMLWFYIGMLFERNRKAINDRFNFKNFIIFSSLWFILFVLAHLVPKNIAYFSIFESLLSIPITLFGMIFTYSLCNIISKTKLMNSKIIKLINKHSYSIYLYSDAYNYVILYIFVSLFTINSLENELCSILLFLIRFFLTTTIPIIISYIIKKLNIKYLS